VQKHLNPYIVVPTLFPSSNALSANKFKLIHRFAVTLFTISSPSSTMFQTPRTSCKCAHAYYSSGDVIVFCCFDMFFDTVIVFI